MKNTLPPTHSSGVSARPWTKRVDRAFVWLPCKIHQYFRKTKWPPINLEDFTASRCSVNTFSHVCHYVCNFYTHLNHCHSYVLLGSQLETPKFSKNCQGHCTLRDSPPQWEGHPHWLRYRQMRLLTGEKWREFDSSSTKPARATRKRVSQHWQG